MINGKVNGMTLELCVDGFVGSPRHIDVIFTSDSTGETLTLGCSTAQIIVPFEEVEKLIERERAKHDTT